ncbi:uncharacterized protein LOC135828956 [Sycon ciliatum]|uniref:uncharacterized protein LOC135828956 n=1 Tax=Sycon ciliatum TaxID=27933 RepID=UPI0031F65998
MASASPCPTPSIVEVPTQSLVLEFFSRRSDSSDASVDAWPVASASAANRTRFGLRRSFSEDPSLLRGQRKSGDHRRQRLKPLQDNNNSTNVQLGASAKSHCPPLAEADQEDDSDDFVVEDPVLKTVGESSNGLTTVDCARDSEVLTERITGQCAQWDQDDQACSDGPATLLMRRRGSLKKLIMPSRANSTAEARHSNSSPKSPCELVVERLAAIGDAAEAKQLACKGVGELVLIRNIIYPDFERVGKEKFVPDGGRMSWQTIAAFLFFSHAIAQHMGREDTVLAWAAKFIADNFLAWVESQGGWMALLNYSQQKTQAGTVHAGADDTDYAAGANAVADVCPADAAAAEPVTPLTVGGVLLVTAAAVFILLGIALAPRR